MHEGNEGSAADRIRLSGIAATGFHGVFEHERRDGQQFVADVVLHVDTRTAAATDRLDRTVDYGVLAQQVAGVLTGEPADLLETVAERIAALALDHHGVSAVDVVVHKPQAPVPVPFTDVAVEIHRSRVHLPSLALAPAQDAPSPDAPPGLLADVAPDPTPSAPDEWEHDAARAVVLGEIVRGAHLAAAVGPSPVLAEPILPAPGASIDPALALLGLPELTPAGPPVAVLPVDAEPVAVPTLVPETHATAAAPDPSAPVAPPSVEQTLPEWQQPEPADRLDAAPAAPVDMVLALGSNLGPSQETLRQAISDLAAVDGLEITSIAPLARTGSVGGGEQPDYLNTVVLGRTTLSPRALLHACQAIEAAHGRVRDARWGARTLDIDVVLHGATVAVADDLELPHPRAHQRAFVLEPWAQVDPDAVLPGLGGGPVAALAQTAPDREGIRWLALDWWGSPADGA